MWTDIYSPVLQAYDNSLIWAVDKILKAVLDYYARYESANSNIEGCLYTVPNNTLLFTIIT